MKNSNFKVTLGEAVTWQNQPFTATVVNAGQVGITHTETGVVELFTTKKFEDAYFSGVASFPDRSGAGVVLDAANDNLAITFELSSEDDQAHALKVREYMVAIRAQYPGRASNKALMEIRNKVAERIADPKPLSKSQLRRYLKYWDDAGGDIRSLLPKVKNRGNRTSRMHPKLQVMILDAIVKAYEVPGEPTVTNAYNALCSMVTKYNDRKLPNEWLELPSERTLRAYIKKRMGHEATARRTCKKAMHKQYSPVYEGKVADRPLQRVQIDTNTMDVFVLKNGKPVRPYLTLMLDEYSRCVVGYYIGFEKPCAENALKCLFHAMNRKNTNTRSELNAA